MSPRHLADLLEQQADRRGPCAAIRFKEHGLFHDVSWRAYREMARAGASALIERGIQAGDRVGVLAENSRDWLIADMAILTAGAVTVAPHAPLPPRQVHYQLADAGVRWLFVSSSCQRDKVRQIRAELPSLLGMVVFDPAAGADDALSWRGFLQRGRAALKRTDSELHQRLRRLGPDDLATLMYTSGTTGPPKGVMLSHGNLLSNAMACEEASPRGPGAVILNWLPLSHIYARTVDHYLCLAAGGVVCLAECPESVVADLQAIEPTHVSCVPRFYEKLFACMSGLDPAVLKKKLHAIFGPRIIWLGSGGAPLPERLADTFAGYGLHIQQGYGLTESSPVITFNRKDHYNLHSVGQALPGVEVKTAEDGEVLTRGPHVMKGYWNNPRATADVLRDGWLCTGDLGRLDAEGFLFITGRKKDLLVLSSGKKVVPNHVEALILQDPCVDQAVVYGEGRSYLIGLIVPNWVNLRLALKIDGAPGRLAVDRRVLDFLTERIDRQVTDLASWERPKKLVIVAEPFSAARDEMTVSMKLRRQVIFEHHREELESLYQG